MATQNQTEELEEIRRCLHELSTGVAHLSAIVDDLDARSTKEFSNTRSGALLTAWYDPIVNPLLGPIRQIQTVVNGLSSAVVNQISTTLLNIRRVSTGVATFTEHKLISLINDEKEKIIDVIQQHFNPMLEVLDALLAAEKILEHYAQRTLYVINSLNSFSACIDPNVDPKPAPELEDVKNNLRESGAKYIIRSSIGFFLDHNPISHLLLALKNPSPAGFVHLMIPFKMPDPDILHKWIGENGIDEEEREFRKHFLASLDQYLRGKYPARGELAIKTGTDTQTAITILNESISVMASCVTDYIFRHPNVPSLSLPKLAWTSLPHPTVLPFHGAHIVSTGTSRTLSYTIQGVLGTVGRGVWEINAHNTALVEGLVTLLSSMIGSVLQSVSHDLFWLLEIKEVYQEDIDDDCLASWSAVPTEGELLIWGVYFRENLLPKTIDNELKHAIRDLLLEHSDISAPIIKLLKSYSAYMDSIREFNEDSSETEGNSPTPDIAPVFDPKTGNLDIKISLDSEFKPVMRAYYNGHSRVLKRVLLQGSTHLFETTFVDILPGKVLYLRTNYGHQHSIEVKG